MSRLTNMHSSNTLLTLTTQYPLPFLRAIHTNATENVHCIELDTRQHNNQSSLRQIQTQMPTLFINSSKVSVINQKTITNTVQNTAMSSSQLHTIVHLPMQCSKNLR